MGFLRCTGLAWIRLLPSRVGQVGGIGPWESLAKSLRTGIKKNEGPDKALGDCGMGSKSINEERENSDT